MTFTVGASLTLTTTAVPTLRVGTPAGVTLRAAGGSGHYRWSAVDPLPAGLVVSPDGLLGGTPRTAGTTSVRLRATDAAAPAYGVTTRFTVVVAR